VAGNGAGLEVLLRLRGSGVATLVPGQWIVAANVNPLRIIGKAEAEESSPGLPMDTSSGKRGR